jgi:hypothetical protein
MRLIRPGKIARLFVVLALLANDYRVRHVVFCRKLGVSRAHFVVAPCAVPVPLACYEDRALDVELETTDSNGVVWLFFMR